MGVFANTFNAIANAIKAKDGGGDMTPAQMAGRIAAIETIIPEGGWKNDGKTHLWTKILDTYTGTYSTCIRMNNTSFPTYSGTIYWGDGTSNTIVNSGFNVSHLYSLVQSDYEVIIDTPTMTTISGVSVNNIWDQSGNGKTPYARFIELSNHITRINNYAFTNCRCLINVHLPSSITEVGVGSFSNSSQLRFINIENVETIENNAFQNCQSLETVDFSSCSTIGNNSFQNCYNLREIDINGPIVTIGNYAFQYCVLVGKVKVGEGCTSVGDNAFSQMKNITVIDFPSTIESIGANCFQYNLNHVLICRATTPPSISSNTLSNETSILVPSSAVDTYKAATNWSAKASIISAITE